jgi:arylsulfatase A-like enzyme
VDHGDAVNPYTFLPLLLLAACGGPDGPSPGPDVSSEVQLERVGPAPAAERIVRTVSIPVDALEWPCDAPKRQIVEVGERHALHMRGGARHELVIPGSYAPGEFNLLRVEVAARRDTTLRAGLRNAQGQAAGSNDVAFLPAGERRVLDFDLRAMAAYPAPFDELILLANRQQKANQALDWSLLRVTLIDRPLERWLPTVDEAPALIDLKGEARRGYGLAGGSPLRAQVKVPAGAHLRLSYGPAPRAAPQDPETRLVVRADGEVLARVAPQDGWAAATWNDLSLDLAPWTGEQLALEFALETPGDRPALAAIEAPTVVIPDRRAATVLLVTSDTHRAEYLGRADLGVSVRTPAIDNLAARGVFFEDCFASANTTLPSHVALMTGRDPAATGVINNRTRLAARANTLAERFEAEGWATYAVTSAKHMNDGWSGLGQGFERYDWPPVERERQAPESVARLLNWLPDADGRPLFVWLHLFDAHRPYAPPEELARGYYGSDADPFSKDLPEPSWPAPPNLIGLRDLAWAEACYRGEVSYLDSELARVLAVPRFAEGIVAFTSDHGEALGDQGIWWEHLGVYPAVLHVPMILAWPGAPQGRRIEAPVRNFDLARTLLQLAGLEEGDFPGRDLTATWNDGALSPMPRFAFGSDGHALSVTSAGWHLVVSLKIPSPDAYTRDPVRDSPVELYHLTEDPGCTEDLAQGEDERVARLGGALLRWLENAEGALAERNEVDEAAAGMLTGLGYAAGGEASETGLINIARVRDLLAPWLDK